MATLNFTLFSQDPLIEQWLLDLDTGMAGLAELDTAKTILAERINLAIAAGGLYELELSPIIGATGATKEQPDEFRDANRQSFLDRLYRFFADWKNANPDDTSIDLADFIPYNPTTTYRTGS